MTWRHISAILGVFALSLVTTGCNCCNKCRTSACMPAPGPACCPAAPGAPAPAQTFYSGPAPAPCCSGS